MASEAIEYKGVEFRRYPDSKNTSDRKYFRPGCSDILKGIGYLHQEIWKDQHGEIPEGSHIHHKDGNPSNNSIDNLECINGRKHVSAHAKAYFADPERYEHQREHLANIQELAKEWHGSEEGIEWHRKHGIEAYKNRKPLLIRS